jgi:oxygen-independent coproporphyrinogen-3 oxidase
MKTMSSSSSRTGLSAHGIAGGNPQARAGYDGSVTPQHLYVHVPFCLRRCSYCDFAVSAQREPPIAAWLDAIERELELRSHAREFETLALRTIYVGGGTPSLLGPGGMAELARRLRRFAAWDADAEWTAEANPETFTHELAADWREAGVNRISLGAQTFAAAALSWMGRLHGPDGPAKALSAARDAGFDNVGLDLIFGLPERLERDWSADLDRALVLAPEHLSLYGLTAEPATPLGRWVKAGKEDMPDEERYEAEYLEAVERLSVAGYAHYEVSNFARPGRASRHNRAYWEGAAWVGLGPGAHSYLPPRRSWNVRDWAEYRDRVLAGTLPEESRETVDAAGHALERTWLGLRTTVGLGGLSDRQREMVRTWCDRGWARWLDDRIMLTPRGWLLLDRLVVELDGAA